MKTWEERYEECRALWRKKGRKAIEKEVASLRSYMQRYQDGFSQVSAPDELSDGDRLMALRDELRELER